MKGCVYCASMVRLQSLIGISISTRLIILILFSQVQNFLFCFLGCACGVILDSRVSRSSLQRILMVGVDFFLPLCGHV